MDETTKQLIVELKAPLPVAPGHPARYEHQYQRQGVANLFLALEPLTGSGQIQVTERHTKSDWAWFLRALVDHYYPQADTITLIMDNLNTYTKAALYEVFPPLESPTTRLASACPSARRSIPQSHISAAASISPILATDRHSPYGFWL
ncbi:MAG: transposase [Candidatus Latescibacterota bacterium]|jgi:hypothetical protein